VFVDQHVEPQLDVLFRLNPTEQGGSAQAVGRFGTGNALAVCRKFPPCRPKTCTGRAFHDCTPWDGVTVERLGDAGDALDEAVRRVRILDDGSAR
jgi:hypothetical protein